MNVRRASTFAVVAGLALAALPRPAQAHCDAMDGPVVTEAAHALEKGDVTPVLKWVAADQEGELREAFRRTVAVRGQGDEAKALADRWFFETLVRLHRASEGAPFTGLKPAGTDPGPAVRLADRALDRGQVEPLVQAVTRHVAEGIRERHRKAHATRAQAGQSVEAGRRAVHAYVDYVHFVEGVHQAAEARGHAAPAGADHAAEAEDGHAAAHAH